MTQTHHLVTGGAGFIGSNIVERLVGRDADEVTLIPYDEAYEPGFEDMRRRVPDVIKIRQAVGWEPTVALKETLRQVIAHEQANVS